MEKLIGKKVSKIFISESQEYILFEAPDEEICYRAYGECCSYSWFEEIIGADSLRGDIAREFDLLPLPDMEAYCKSHNFLETDEEKIYGVRVKADKGDTDIIFRNSSNGYYGGWYVLDKKPDGEKFIEIMGDDSIEIA